MKQVSMFVVAMCLVAMCLGAMTAGASPDAVDLDVLAPAQPAQTPAAPGADPVPEVVDEEASSLGMEWTVGAELETANSGGVVCTFQCNDGIGYVYPCPDPSLGTCCAQAQPACASNGGLDTGVCKKGRLGLLCNPL